MHMMGEFVCLLFTCGRDLKPINFMKDHLPLSKNKHANTLRNFLQCVYAKANEPKEDQYLVGFRLAPQLHY
jgi:hypothetical protein